jgi:hypothetical protein
VRLKLSDLFEGLGYSARCQVLSGREVEIAGFVIDSHDGRSQLLVSDPGGCPDCSPVPVAAINLPEFRIANPGGPVTLRGMLSYGFVIDGEGRASFLRLEKARLATGLPT